MARYLLVAGLFILSLITYIDRAAISGAKDLMSAELGLSDQAMGAVFSAFALGYAIAQVPSGWLADRIGPRATLSLIVVAWSVLTWLTGAISNFSVLLAIRFLFGAAEAGAFPGAARAFHNWLPPSEHGRANGIMFAGSRLGAAGAFPLMAWLLGEFGWRSAFYVLALPGLVWVVGWWLLFRDRPAAPPAIEQPKSKSFAGVMGSRVMALAMVQYFATNFTTFLTLSWMNPYLKQQFQLSAADAAWYSMWPLMFGAGSQWITGTLIDRLYQSRWKAWSRAFPAILGFVMSGTGMIWLAMAGTPQTAVAAFVLAAFGADMTISPGWAFCLDIGGKNSGAVSGAMNMAGNFGSFVSANAFPFLFGVTGGIGAYCGLTAAMSVISILCWLGMRRGVR